MVKLCNLSLSLVSPRSPRRIKPSVFVCAVIILVSISFFIISFIRPSNSDSWIVHDQINRLHSNSLTKHRSLNPNQKFLVRDWEIWIGFNNVRYTIEAALLIAKILGRTLVLPAFTYARACDVDEQQCNALTPMFQRGVAVDISGLSDRGLYPDPEPGQNVLYPILEQEKAWVLPMDVLLDLEHIIATWGNAIRLDDFLKLTNPDTSFHSIGTCTGKWNTNFNLDMTYRKMPNSMFTNFNLTMVDRLPKPITPLIDRKSSSLPASSPLIKKCESTLQKFESSIPLRRRNLAEFKSKHEEISSYWDESLIQGDQLTGNLAKSDNLMLESCLASSGFRSAYGYGYMGWWMKAPNEPNKVVKRLKKMVGWWDELHRFDEQILHIEGSIHNGFPPGSMIWTSLEGRREYEKLTRTAIRPPQYYHKIAAKLESKIRARCGGRSWVGAHMRRGDFWKYEWSALNITHQWDKIESNTRNGVNLVQEHPELLKPIHQQFNTSLEPPRLDDPIYIATDIRKPDEVAYLRTKNIILLTDILDKSDQALLGFSGKFMDTLSVLEQCLMMRSAFFYGDAHSSVDGWVLNRRTSFGISDQVTKIDYLKHPGDGQ